MNELQNMVRNELARVKIALSIDPHNWRLIQRRTQLKRELRELARINMEAA